MTGLVVVRTISYERQTHNSVNPFTRFAHRSRYKISLAFASKLLPKDRRIVDFGAGQGTFLARLHAERPDARLTAIEPYMTIQEDFIERVATVDEIGPGSVALMTAFETLEHVTDEQLEAFLAGTSRALEQDGALLVTVPIMYGATLPVKEMSRALLHRRWGDTSPGEILRAAAGRSIPRAENRLVSHKGFDFRWLDRMISRHFTIVERSFSPFSALPWWSNSQAIFVGKPKTV